MLTIAFNEFKVWAKILKEEDGIDYEAKGREVIQVMADGYCYAKDTDNERNKNKYIAGLMLRFWYAISKLKARSPIQGLDYMDFMGWLYESIEYACKCGACVMVCKQDAIQLRHPLMNQAKFVETK